MEILIIVLFTLVNAVFAMSELAVVSSRKARLQQMVEDGSSRAKAALDLANEPNRFLSTTQIGITLIGIGAGAFGGATVAEQFALQLKQIPLLAPYSETLAVLLVVAFTTYLSLVIGELVPKRLAMRYPETIAMNVAAPMNLLSKISSPLVSLLGVSTDFVLRLLGLNRDDESPVTEAEVISMIEQGAEAGVFEAHESAMVEGIFRLGELRVSELMTPRNDVIALDLNAPSEENRSLTVESPFSAYPVYRDNLDNVVGVVQSKHLLSHLLTGQALDIDQVMQKPIFIPESAAAAQALALFKETRVHMALVLDEYGGVIGLITLKDIIQEVVGDIRNKQYDPDIVQREDGSWLFDGILPIYRLSETLPDLQIPVHEEGSYTTLSGFIMVRLGRIPTVGDHFKWHEFRFEVIDMDGNHIDKVLVQKIV